MVKELQTSYKVYFNTLKTIDFIEGLDKLDKNKAYFIYCRSGNRSKKSSEILKEIGFVKVYDLLGGYKNWIKNSN